MKKRFQLCGVALAAAGLLTATASMAQTVGAKAPVWAPSLGKVPLEQYTPVGMTGPDCIAGFVAAGVCVRASSDEVKAGWTPEQVHTATAVDLVTPDGSVRRALISDQVTLPDGATVISEPIVVDNPPSALPPENGGTRTPSLNPGREEVQRHDLHYERLTQFQHIVLSVHSIGVNFVTGTSSCYGSRAVLVEKDDSIGIAVINGTIPEAPEACILIAVHTHFVLNTEKPIGNRPIVPLTEAQVQLNK